MPPQAVEIFDRRNGWTQELEDRPSGMVGVRHFKVDTRSIIRAYDATGLPSAGDHWPEVLSVLNRSLVVQNIKPIELGGRDTADTGGWTIVRVDYAEPNSTNGNPDSGFVAGDAYSSVAGSLRTVQVSFDVDGSKIPDTQREVTTDELIVTAYKTSQGVINATPVWFDIRNTVNADAVIIPPLWKTAGIQVIDPNGGGTILGQLLARTRSVRPITTEDDLFAIEYRFGFGPPDAFKFAWREQDETGATSGPEMFSDVQEEKPWPLLFGSLF